MEVQEFDEILTGTLEDGQLSRAEKAALRERLATCSINDRQRDILRSRIFALARTRCSDPNLLPLIDWLADVTGILERAASRNPAPAIAPRAWFSPGPGPRQAIQELLATTRSQVDICVFTITDDRIARTIRETHQRGVKVRIIADDDKTLDLGSDVNALRQAGVPVRLDSSPYHMHHKFAVSDGSVLLTGSYNWTRGAADENEENLLILGEPSLVRTYAQEFEELWRKLG